MWPTYDVTNPVSTCAGTLRAIAKIAERLDSAHVHGYASFFIATLLHRGSRPLGRRYEAWREMALWLLRSTVVVSLLCLSQLSSAEPEIYRKNLALGREVTASSSPQR